MSQINYISAQGAKKLRDELDHLVRVERPQVVNTVSAAAAEGDRSENAEYIYGKKRLREIDRRVRFLGKRLDDCEIVAPPTTTDKVRFLSWVVAEDEEGAPHTMCIAGADESDPKAGFISWKSPVGRALLGKQIDDEITVNTPGGEKEFVILEIHTERP
ncbi:MAG: transcription elongation factor GreB [Bradymonadia bacterium]